MPRCLRSFVLLCLGLCVAVPVYAQSLEDAVLEEINFARTQPREYARELREYRASFRGRIVSDRHGERMTFEGVRAVDEAIAFLERQQPLPPLRRGHVLALAAYDHAAEQGNRGSWGHISNNGATPGKRVSARGGGRFVSETISYGENDPVGVVRSLIVDDGVANRGHRTVIFTSNLRFAGVGCGPHAAYDYLCVMDYGQTADGQPAGPSYARSEVGFRRDWAF